MESYHIVGAKYLNNYTGKYHKNDPRRLATPTSAAKKANKKSNNMDPIFRKSDLLNQHYLKENIRLGAANSSLNISRTEKINTTATFDCTQKHNISVVRVASMHKKYQSLWE